LVRREPDPKDRRMMWVQLTPKGETLIKAMLPLHFRMMACLMQPLSETERKTMVKLLNKVLEQASSQRTTTQPS
jgi:DNA-binding MarR family transcriptional regulator